MPARSDDDAASLGRFELAASGVSQLDEGVGTEVRQCVPLEPAPKKFDWIELRCIARQEMELNPARSRSDVVADQVAAMQTGAVPDNEQRASEVSAQRFEELDNLLFGDGRFMQAKAQAGEVHAGNQRQLMPVEVELHRWGLAPHNPGAHQRGSLGDSGLVYEDDQFALASVVFFSADHVRLRQCSIAAASRSRARRSGFWLDKPSCPSKRHTWTSLYRTPNSRSIQRRTRLSVHSGVAKPCAVAPSSSATYNRDNSAAPNRAGRPPLLMLRSASMPLAASTSRPRYTGCCGAPTRRANSGGLLPASSSRPARTA